MSNVAGMSDLRRTADDIRNWGRWGEADELGTLNLITADKAGESLIGIILNGVALTVMVPVALAQGRTGRGLDNPVLVAQSKETWLSDYLHRRARRPGPQQPRRLMVGRPHRRPRHRSGSPRRRNRGLERGVETATAATQACSTT